MMNIYILLCIWFDALYLIASIVSGYLIVQYDYKPLLTYWNDDPNQTTVNGAYIFILIIVGLAIVLTQLVFSFWLEEQFKKKR